MRKVLAIIFSILFFVTMSFAVVGCKKAEEKKPAEPPKASAPAPGATGATGAAGVPAPAKPPAK